MYRCEICKELSGPGEPRLTHIISRPRVGKLGQRLKGTEIARELNVCRTCAGMLVTKSLAAVTLLRGRTVPPDKLKAAKPLLPTPKPLPPPPPVEVPALLGRPAKRL